MIIDLQSVWTVLHIGIAAGHRALRKREGAGTIYAQNPALPRLAELETLRDLSHTATARLYISLNGDAKVDETE